MIKFCNKCKEEKRKECPSGYSFWWNDNISICPYDKNELQNIDFEAEDLSVISEISEEPTFIEAMIDIREKDPIEYQLKMSQFKTNLAQQKVEKENCNNTPHCPTCNSTNIKKISGLSKAGSVAAFGLFSRKIHKQWHCNNCGSEW